MEPAGKCEVPKTTTQSPFDQTPIEFDVLARRYLDTVRDSIIGLTHRTTEKGCTMDGVGIAVKPLDILERVEGRDWPIFGLTMVGQRRMHNIEWALRKVVTEGVQGDFMECGVWRGGASIFARAVLDVLGESRRKVILADSFEGLPAPRTSNDPTFYSKIDYLRVSLETVKINIASYGINPESVNLQYCKGYFVDSLPVCHVDKLAVLRMDGDMYESTMDQLFNLYNKVSIGGVVIVDDYCLPGCFLFFLFFFCFFFLPPFSSPFIPPSTQLTLVKNA
eukprot:TRINITY_DN1278_c0_g3_i2.p1 TRINITY_DN1278_c0_g3~~TRINITY_DN1278_c0_g3_i2.p1  ORF type:complete len:315 (-),score=69.74 TRINITY_DN1278_c0_g3_i2:13-846(-)